MPGYRKLGRPTAHRRSMLRNLVTDLFRDERIQTTDKRAKEARRVAEKLITLAKRGDLHARRQALAYMLDETTVKKLFDEIKVEKKEKSKEFIGYLMKSGLISDAEDYIKEIYEKVEVEKI